MDFERIRDIAYDALGDTPPDGWKEKGNKYHHGQRVAALARALRERIFPENAQWDDILTVAALFHDVKNGSVPISEHAAKGATETKRLLQDVVPAEALGEICELIARHDERKGEDLPDVLRILQDADHLDHFGSYDVWRSMMQAAHQGLTYPEMVEHLLQNAGGNDGRFLSELHFDQSKGVYRDRTAFFRAFAHRLQVESQGKIFHE